ncbi:hypothetical protein KUTeg_006414 [Tegillarca granosa]|uniref:Fibronectin type-III domain-containing protein n=1 Tax=Tegillarca granosa TaxID=220873 RepID=A0ABQ9FGH3_TEGGR|nr:hypothetical protein KUTeg_006414 [Tegillarca granosa]
MAALLFMMIFLVIIYTSQCQTCLPPTDLKTTVVNNYKDLQLTWNKPTTGPEVLSFVIYINAMLINSTKEPTYLIRNPQFQVYDIFIDSNCGQFGYSSRFSVNID